VTLGMTGISNVCVVLAPKFTGYCDPGHTKLFDLKSCFFAPNRASPRTGLRSGRGVLKLTSSAVAPTSACFHSCQAMSAGRARETFWGVCEVRISGSS
jgi:hypothetical protein